MYRLQSVPNIGEGPADDNRHRVVEVGLFDFVLYRDGYYSASNLFHSSTPCLSIRTHRTIKLPLGSCCCAKGRCSACLRPRTLRITHYTHTVRFIISY